MPSRPAAGQSLQRRLLRFSVAVCCLVLLVGGVSLGGWLRVQEQTDLLTVRFGPTADTLHSVRDLMNLTQASVRALVHEGVRPPPRGGEELHSSYRGARSALVDAMASLDRRLVDIPADSNDLDRDELLRRGARFRSTAGTWLEQTDRLANRASGASLGSSLLAFDEARWSVDSLGELLDRYRFAAREASREAVLRTIVAIAVVTALAGVLALVASRRMSRALTVPLEHLRDVVHRQRQGDRTAWARTDLGAAEVGQLAADINALTAAQFQLLDEQSRVLRLQLAVDGVGRRIREESGPDRVNAAVADEVCDVLRAARVWVGCVLPDGTLADLTSATDDPGPMNTWSAETQQEMGQAVLEQWHANRALVCSATVAGRDRDSGLRALDPGHALLVVPFGPTRHTVGVLVVHGDDERADWSAAEVAFVEAATGKLGRAVAAQAAEREREDYIRRLEDLDRRKDDFMATVSHELRTPLANIVGYLELLEDGEVGDLDPPQQRMLQVVSRNVRRLHGLIDDLLVLNQLQAGAPATGRNSAVDLGGVVRQVAAEFADQAREKDVTLDVAASTAVVHGDGAQLSRALINVLANAVQFSSGGGKIRLCCAPTADGREVEVVCTDTGMGIPASDQDQIFTRFFRASNATQAQIQGTGLGLMIIRAVIERHGGRVDLQSREGVGTTVRLTLPVWPVPDGADTTRSREAADVDAGFAADGGAGSAADVDAGSDTDTNAGRPLPGGEFRREGTPLAH